MLRYFIIASLLLGVGPLQAGDVDTSSMMGKVVCGYQGWFRCEGDGSNNGWHHYAAGGEFAPGHAHIDLWPDVSELAPADRVATEFRHADGRVAEVYSSVNAAAVRLHFEWMRQYGLDGVMLQRFATSTRDSRFREPMNQVLDHVRTSAAATGRGWALMYDLSGLQPGQFGSVEEDWRRLLAERRIVRDGTDRSYFQHRGRPLVALWGLGFHDRPPALAEWGRLIDFLKTDAECGGVSLMLGVPYHWRTGEADCIADPALQALLARADILSPWAVGRLATPQDAAGRVESRLRPDLARAAEFKVDYMPVAFPGFSWQNLEKSRGREAKLDAIPRRHGAFLWSQAVAARRAGAGMLYVAMFDELDEGTAIFKVTQDPPAGASAFVREEGLPSDHYLRLTGEIGRLFRGERPLDEAMPAAESAKKQN